MEIDVRHDGQVTVLVVQGSIDALTADAFLKAMEEEVAQGHRRLVIDLSGTSYASSAGLRAVLVALKECRQQGGDLRLAALHKGVARVFEMSGFNSILKIYDEVDAAVDSFGEAA